MKTPLEFYKSELERINNKKPSIHYLITNQKGVYTERLNRLIKAEELLETLKKHKWWEFWKYNRRYSL
jgi:hypothetical protein